MDTVGFHWTNTQILSASLWCCCAVFGGVLLTKIYRYLVLVNSLPGPKGNFLFGNAWKFLVDHDEIVKVFEEYTKSLHDQPFICLWMFHKKYIIIFKASAAEELLNSTKHIRKSSVYKFVEPWLGTGLLTSTGQKWQKHRKLLTPSFHFQILEDFMHSFNEQSEILVSKLNQLVGKGCFDIWPYITLCTLDIICDTAMGKQIGAQKNSDSDYVKAIKSLGEIFMLRSARPWLHPNWIFNLTSLGRKHKICLKILHNFTDSVIREKKRALYEKPEEIDEQNNVNIPGKKRRMAFLDTLLASSDVKNQLDDKDLRAEVDTFMFEGHDTTAASINWTLFLLGSHPEIQQNVYTELREIIGKPNRCINHSDITKLKYLEAVIKESLRLFPSVALFGRALDEDLVIAGHNIPANTDVIILSMLLQRDPEVYPNPDNFDPERFLYQDSKRMPLAYIPFSAGPRNCIGQKFAMIEMKVVLSYILINFKIKSHDSKEDLKLIAEPILRSANSLRTEIFKRDEIS